MNMAMFGIGPAQVLVIAVARFLVWSVARKREERFGSNTLFRQCAMEGRVNPNLRAIHDISLWTGGFGLVIGAIGFFLSGETGWGLLCLASGTACFASIWIGRIRDKLN
jgi:hypothetical protein